MKGFDWIFWVIMFPPLCLAIWELLRTGVTRVKPPKP